MNIDFDTQFAKDYGVYPAIMFGYFNELIAKGIKTVEGGQFNHSGWCEYFDDDIKFLKIGIRKKAINKLVRIGCLEVDGNLFKIKY